MERDIGWLSNYVVIDTETTGISVEKAELIEVAGVKVENNEIVSTFSEVVKAREYISVSKEITELTGITNEMVDKAPRVGDVLPKYKDFIGDSVILGHNVNYDIRVLCKYPECVLANKYIDMLYIAKRELDLKHNRLCDVAKQLGVSDIGAHRALADCMMVHNCYQILKSGAYSRDCTKVNEEMVYELKKPHMFGPKAKDIEGIDGQQSEDSFLYNKTCVITGELEKMTRNDAMQLIANIGGINADSVTKKTNILIIGNKQSTGVKKDKSSKQEKAEKLIAKGQDIKIISEQEFYNIIESYTQGKKEKRVENAVGKTKIIIDSVVPKGFTTDTHIFKERYERKGV